MFVVDFSQRENACHSLKLVYMVSDRIWIIIRARWKVKILVGSNDADVRRCTFI